MRFPAEINPCKKLRESTARKRRASRKYRIANASRFGLGGGVLTADIERGERIAAERLDASAVFVNENVRSDPRMPFGGKNSGFGREGGAHGIREFVNAKTVHVRALAGALSAAKGSEE